MVIGKFGDEPLPGLLGAVALDAGEGDFELLAILHRMDADGGLGWLRLGDDGLGGEIEGDAEDVGVFDIEEAFLIEFVGLAAQAAADDLLAKELGAEGADTEYVGDGVRIPALGEHGDGDDAADLAAELAGLADGVHYLAEEIGIGFSFRHRNFRCAG